VKTRDFLIKSSKYNKNIILCKDCIDQRENAIKSIEHKYKLSESTNYKHIAKIDTRKSFLDKSFVIWLLEYNAYDIGGDTISNIQFEENYDYTTETQWETKRYSIWRGRCDVFKKIIE
jgi:hypothetical protein